MTAVVSGTASHLDDLHDLATRVGVQPRGGLVEEHHPRLTNQRNAHIRPLRLRGAQRKTHEVSLADMLRSLRLLSFVESRSGTCMRETQAGMTLTHRVKR